MQNHGAFSDFLPRKEPAHQKGTSEKDVPFFMKKTKAKPGRD